MDSSFQEIRPLENLSRNKYRFFVLFCLLVHILILTYSLVFGITLLAIFNCASILCYIVSYIILMRGNNILPFYIGYMEIILHSFATNLIIGNQYGFSLYFLVSVPMAFNLLHDYNKKSSIYKSLFLSFLSFLLYTICYALSKSINPLYQSPELKKTVTYVFMINILIAFLSSSMFCLIFIYETDEAMNKLYNKNKELNVLANRDTLTGLYNRRTMTEHVMRMYEDFEETKVPFALIICDIDDFKMVNDSLGHDCGDLVLKSLARVLTGLTRDNDFLCRWGGEEFLILLNNINLEQARATAERFRSKIKETEMRYKDTVLSVTMTFGVAVADESTTYEELFRLADHRLYEGKNNGKDQVV